MQSVIYCIRNTANEKRYIGSAKDFSRRKYEHLKQLKNGTHGNRHLLRAWRTYGSGQFQFYVVEYVNDVTKLIPREQYWIDVMQPEYNICKYAGSRLGMQHGEETRRIIGEASIARWKSRPGSMLGKTLSPESRAKIAAARIGKRLSPESIAKREATKLENRLARESMGIFSQRRSDELRRVRKNSPEHKLKCSLKLRGEGHPLSKLTEKDVTDIRRIWLAGGRSQQSIADQFGVAQAYISSIVLGKSWKHVPFPEVP